MNKESFKKNGARWAVISSVFIVASILVLMQAIPSPRIGINDQGFAYINWGPGMLASANETVPTATLASSCLEIYIVNHTAAPLTCYNGTSHNASNKFEYWAQSSMDADSTGTTYNATSYFTGCNGGATAGFFRTMTINWGATHVFDIVVRVRVNTTNCGNGAAYVPYSVMLRMNLTGSFHLSYGAGTRSNQDNGWGVSYNGSATYASGRFLYMNFYWNQNGSGYYLPKGGTLTITNIQLLCNY